MGAYVTGALGVLVVVFLWVGVQHWARKQSPELPSDCDMLEVGERCAGCAARDKCGVARRAEDDG